MYVYVCCCCQVALVVSDSVRLHGLQPTRLLCPWDSPGKNTGVGCHFLLQCMKVESESEVTQSCLTLSDRPHGLRPTRFLHPWDFPGNSTGVGCYCLLPCICVDICICVYTHTSVYTHTLAYIDRYLNKTGGVCTLA